MFKLKIHDEDDFLASMSNRRSVSKQVEEYLSTIRKITKESRENTRLFWLKYENDWPELAAYTKAVLTVPASSAAVERVFSVGGAIYGHRDEDCQIGFLKCLCF